MPKLRSSLRAVTGFAAAMPALSLAVPAMAQSELPPLPVPSQVSPVDVQSVPPVPTTDLPRPTFGTETTVGPDGVETITRTRRIERSAPYPESVKRGPFIQRQAYPQGHSTYPGGPIAPAPVVFEREQWLAECERRTNGRSEKEKGGIIGGLLGAVAGGIIGNRVAGSGDRLAGTLIGAGTGGLGGLLLGNLIGGGKKNDRYDCEAALDGYTSQYGQPGAARVIPGGYPGHGYYPGYAPAYTGHYGYSAGCGCQQAQIVWVPVRSEIRQRVIVRETVREERIPGARIIPPRPSPKMIKQTPRPVPAPRPIKMIKN